MKQYSRDWAAAFSDPRDNITKNIPRVQCEYHMTVRVAGYRTVDDEKCADFEFLPADDAPDTVKGQGYTLTIAVDTWRPVTLTALKPREAPGYTIEKAGDRRALFTKAYGFPVDWIVERDDFEQKGGREESLECGVPFGGKLSKLKRTVSQPKSDGTVQVKVGAWWPYHEHATEEAQQTWDASQMWWVSFTRWIQGHIDLEAILVKE
ncbi:MAG: hypothetical protein WBE26_12945 [Phycisphaerae bacterium]